MRFAAGQLRDSKISGIVGVSAQRRLVRYRLGALCQWCGCDCQCGSDESDSDIRAKQNRRLVLGRVTSFNRFVGVRSLLSVDLKLIRGITIRCTRSTHSGGCEVVRFPFVPGDR